jgi:hypothetical protein
MKKFVLTFERQIAEATARGEDAQESRRKVVLALGGCR